ncbi:MAG: restriction endonuclease subunit M [Clostridia bacterium]|nr:restriction endonuclease subunit M [Clostridia bacterium]
MMQQNHTTLMTTEIISGIDVLETSIRSLDNTLLNLLLIDRTTKKNILWATKDYVALGIGFEEFSEIRAELITGEHSTLIQPRITKAQGEQIGRTRNRAEVFTPSWICNLQINLIDEQWFGRQNVFNTVNKNSWAATDKPISFDGSNKNWKNYIDAQRLEISCGEAPYLVSRYDTVTGEKIPLSKRIGLLDRKMRIVLENTDTKDDWLKWSQRAFESVYGYEYQGDNLLLARENLLYSYIEYYFNRFGTMPEILVLRRMARIISWNIWQMDGLKYVVPGTCHDEVEMQSNLFSEASTHPCPGCAKNDIKKHNGSYCKIQDWRFKRSRYFKDITMGGKRNARI